MYQTKVLTLSEDEVTEAVTEYLAKKCIKPSKGEHIRLNYQATEGRQGVRLQCRVQIGEYIDFTPSNLGK